MSVGGVRGEEGFVDIGAGELDLTARLYKRCITAPPTYILSRLEGFRGGLGIEELRSTLVGLAPSGRGLSGAELSSSSRYV